MPCSPMESALNAQKICMVIKSGIRKVIVEMISSFSLISEIMQPESIYFRLYLDR